MKGTLFLTGGTGLLGSHIAEKFRINDFAVKCLAREGSNTSFLREIGCEIVEGDILDQESYRAALLKCDGVIHTAAKVGDWGSYADFYAANVTGTCKLVEAAKDLKRIVLTGSISSYGEENFEGKKNEMHPRNSHYDYFLDKIFPCKMNFYRDTKKLATEEALRVAKDNGVVVTILEPVWLFGEREFRSGFFEYLKTAKQKIPFLPGSKRNRFHASYVKDVAGIYYQVYSSRAESSDTFLVGAPEAPLMEDIYKKICDASGIKKPHNISKRVVYPLGFIMELVATLLRLKNPPLLTRGRVNMFYDNIEYDTSKVEIEYGPFQYSKLDEAISKTVSWYQNNGWI